MLGGFLPPFLLQLRRMVCLAGEASPSVPLVRARTLAVEGSGRHSGRSCGKGQGHWYGPSREPECMPGRYWNVKFWHVKR